MKACIRQNLHTGEFAIMMIHKRISAFLRNFDSKFRLRRRTLEVSFNLPWENRMVSNVDFIFVN